MVANIDRENPTVGTHLVVFIFFTENSKKESTRFSEVDEWLLTEVKR